MMMMTDWAEIKAGLWGEVGYGFGDTEEPICLRLRTCIYMEIQDLPPPPSASGVLSRILGGWRR
jgi:hypothetical protein